MNHELISKYQKQIEAEKELFNKYILIDTGKMPSENFHVKYLPMISKKAQDYGFLLKITNMICALDETNRNIIRVNQAWESFVTSDENSMIFNTLNCYTIESVNAHIIHDIRRFIDDVIAIHWILLQPGNVQNVAMKGLGTYLSDANKDYKVFDSFLPFLQMVNDIENAYKHSVSNNMSTLIGKDEPCIFALYSKHNKDFLNPKMIGISLNQLITGFNTFYKFALSEIEKIK